MRISDWSSDVCSSDLNAALKAVRALPDYFQELGDQDKKTDAVRVVDDGRERYFKGEASLMRAMAGFTADRRSEEHTSELQSLMRISYAVFGLKNKHTNDTTQHNLHTTTSQSTR